MTDFVTEDRQCQVADMTFVATPSLAVRTSWIRGWVPQVSILRPGILHANAGQTKLENSNCEKALGTDTTR